METGKDPRDPDAPEPPTRDRAAILPPGFGKTTKIADWVLSLITTNRDIRILWASKSAPRSTMTGRKIRDQLTQNEKIIGDFGHFEGPKWTQAEWQVSGRDPRIEAPTLRAIGTTTDALGPRCDLAIFDDILDEENTRTPHRRQSLHDWLVKVALSRIDPHRGKPWPYGAAIYLGNPWHRKDEFNMMIDQGLVQPLIWKAYADEARSVSSLPEMYSIEALEVINFRDPVAFEQLYMMNLRGREGTVFDWDWQRHWTRDPLDLQGDDVDPGLKLLPPLREMRLEQGWDLSGGGPTGDFTASAVLGDHIATGDLYVLWGWKKRVEVHDQLTKMRSSVRMIKPDRVKIEKNFNPAVSAFAATIPELRDILYPVTTPSKFSKTERVRLALQAHAARGQLFFPLTKWMWPGDKAFTPRHAEQEFYDFPDAGSDDFVDAVEIARRDPWTGGAVPEVAALQTKRRRI